MALHCPSTARLIEETHVRPTHQEKYRNIYELEVLVPSGPPLLTGGLLTSPFPPFGRSVVVKLFCIYIGG